LIKEAIRSGARQCKSCEILELSERTFQRWLKDTDREDKRKGSIRKVGNKLNDKEKEMIINTACSPEYRDFTPYQIVADLSSKSVYIASESSFYRALREKKLIKHRSMSKVSRKRQAPIERVATAANQLYSWDITYLSTNVNGIYYYLYLIMDVWSRCIVGWSIHESESSEYSEKLIEQTIKEQNATGVVIHSDNGKPMRNGNITSLFQRLGIISSYSRPRISTDNAYSESLFKTMKYRVNYPKRFSNILEAIDWVGNFVNWYNEEHKHSGIKYVTPAQRHNNTDVAILARRAGTYQEAKKKHPERWSRHTRDWSKETVVKLNSVGVINIS